MRIMAFNGSPRTRDWNTVSLLEHALKGAEAEGAETEMVHLYDLQFSGCISCFSCKRIGRKQTGVCAVQDDLSDVLKRVAKADALILGSPIYYGTETASMRAFIERLCFPYNSYAEDGHCDFGRTIPTAMVYTMNIPEEMIETYGYTPHFNLTKRILSTHFGPCEMLLATDTVQYRNYDTYESAKFDGNAKKARRETAFPADCARAFELGKRMAMPLAG